MQSQSYWRMSPVQNMEAQAQARSRLLAGLWEKVSPGRTRDASDEERSFGYALESAKLRNLYLLETVHELAQQRRSTRLHDVFLQMIWGV